MRQSYRSHLCAGTVLAFLIACADAAVAPVAPSIEPHVAAEDATWIARGIAMAMQSSELRATVRDAMRESDLNEHKLVLHEFLSTPAGRRLATAAAAALAVSDERFTRIAEGLPEMDFYAPFARHRREWRATEDVLVGATPDPENRYLEAYSITGEAITLDHEDGVPSSPLLILHPGERKWRRLLPQPSVTGETIEGPDERGPRSDGVRQESVGFNPDSVYIDEFGFGPGDGFGDSELRFEASFRRNSQTIATGRYEHGNVEQGERYDVTAPLIHLAPQPYSYDTLWVELWEDDCCGGDDYYGLVKFVSSDRLVEKCYHCLELTASIIRLDWFDGSNRIPARVTIFPSPVAVTAGHSLQLSYSVFDQAGVRFESPSLHAAPIWHSFNTSVATVSSTGLLTGGPSEASTTVRITVCPGPGLGREGSPCALTDVPVHVQVPIASVVVSPNPVNVPASEWAPVSATAYDANNQPIPGIAFTWQTDNPAIATAYNGSVTGVAQGTTIVRATPSGGRPGPSGTATVNVTAAPPFQVSIQGYGEVPPYTTCRWWTGNYNGVEPYSYRWYVMGSLVSQDQVLSYTSSSSGFDISVEVTDGQGRVATSALYVNVSSSSGGCIDQ